jgi:hypothetical protein
MNFNPRPITETKISKESAKVPAVQCARAREMFAFAKMACSERRALSCNDMPAASGEAHLFLAAMFDGELICEAMSPADADVYQATLEMNELFSSGSV